MIEQVDTVYIDLEEVKFLWPEYKGKKLIAISMLLGGFPIKLKLEESIDVDMVLKTWEEYYERLHKE